MLNRIDSEVNFLQKALNLRTYRQEVLASNIANADTPNYRARDFDFKSALSGALSGRSAGDVTLARTAPGHQAGIETGPYAASLKYRGEYQASADGNTVNMDIERAAFAENALHVEALLTFVRGKFKTLNTAVTSQ